MNGWMNGFQKVLSYPQLGHLAAQMPRLGLGVLVEGELYHRIFKAKGTFGISLVSFVKQKI